MIGGFIVCVWAEVGSLSISASDLTAFILRDVI